MYVKGWHPRTIRRPMGCLPIVGSVRALTGRIIHSTSSRVTPAPPAPMGASPRLGMRSGSTSAASAAPSIESLSISMAAVDSSSPQILQNGGGGQASADLGVRALKPGAAPPIPDRWTRAVPKRLLNPATDGHLVVSQCVQTASRSSKIYGPGRGGHVHGRELDIEQFFSVWEAPGHKPLASLWW